MNDRYLINNGKAPITKIENSLTFAEVKNEDSYSYVLECDYDLTELKGNLSFCPALYLKDLSDEQNERTD